jgi:hypothetical protein
VGQALSPANQFFSVIWTGVFNGVDMDLRPTKADEDAP